MTKPKRFISWINSAPTWIVALGLGVGLAVTYSLTAEWNDPEVNVDAVAAALPAWSLTQRGTIDVTGVGPTNPWVEAGQNGTFSNRPPGIFLTAVPAYFLLGTGDRFSTDPSTLTAVLVTATAMAVCFLTLATRIPSSAALVFTLVLAFGTATWPISSMQLWAHGPGQLSAALAVFGLASGRTILTGSAFAAGILIRPPIAVFPGTYWIGELLNRRTAGRKLLVVIAGGTFASIASLLLYNQAVFGVVDLAGGYPSSFADRLLTLGWNDYLANLADMFVFPPNGLFFWSPVILAASAASFEHNADAPKWARIMAIAGLLYLLVHARMNRASGGLPFNYRYQLEPIVAAFPFLAVVSYRWFKRGGWRRTVLYSTACLSVFLQMLYTLTLSCSQHSSREVICSLGW